MEKPPKKYLQGYKEISESEELKASLPPGSQISPGLDGGTNIFIPFPAGFKMDMPDYRGPWAKIRKEIFRFEELIACDGEVKLPRAKTPPKGMDALCDKWIRDFYQDKNRWDRIVPREIAPWLAARSMIAGMMVSILDTHEAPAPRVPLEKYMCEILIDMWNAGGKDQWHGIHPDASQFSE